ncbi:MAG: hypothetical protein JJE09_00245 [Bacteroidia bacterium]|nr:hypothetical protein [Bacteroidia bacterium]
MKMLPKCLIFSATMALTSLSQAQEINKQLDSFDKIIVSPKINLVLQKGKTESIRIRYSNVASDKINIEVSQ